MNAAYIFDPRDVDREVNLAPAQHLTRFFNRLKSVIPTAIERLFMSWLAKNLRSLLIRIKGLNEISRTIPKDIAPKAAKDFRNITHGMILLEELIEHLPPAALKEYGVKELIHESLKTLYTINGNIDAILYEDEELISDPQLSAATRETGLKNIGRALAKS